MVNQKIYQLFFFIMDHIFEKVSKFYLLKIKLNVLFYNLNDELFLHLIHLHHNEYNEFYNIQL